MMVNQGKRNQTHSTQPYLCGRSSTVWYLAGNDTDPPPTSMYFCFGDPPALLNTLSLASSSDNSLVGVEMASDLGRTRLGEPAMHNRDTV